MKNFNVGDKVKVDFPFKTNQDGKIYKVYRKDGVLGIDYNAPGSFDYMKKGAFQPLSGFCDGIIKKVVENAKIDFIEDLHFNDTETDFLYSILNRAKKCDKLAYQFLGRLKTDCNYYLGYGNKKKSVLWFGNTKNQITFMFYLWACFPADGKPEWLTFGDLMQYEKEILKNDF